jgi:dihydroxyacetone kinase-like predicted kinase
MKIDNMREEHNEKLGLEAEKAEAVKAQSVKKPNLPPKENGFISVSVGDGINEIFKGLGVDYLIEGGQTMNPSTEDMLNAIEQVNAKNIFILPNNKNIILAADQAKAMTKDKNIVVIPSKTIPQGIAAIINFVSGKSIEENEAEMREAMEHVKTGSVTYAVRDTKIDGLEIKNGDFMGLDDKSIKSTGSDIKQVTVDLVETMVEDDSELISIYYGEDSNEESAQEIADALMDKFDFLDVEVHPGNQPVYYYVISVE